MLCVQRCSSAYHFCNVWLFALMSPSCQLRPSLVLLLWPLSLTRPFCPQDCCSFDVFLFFAPNSRDGCAWKSQEVSSKRNTQTSPSGTSNHATVKITEIILFLHSDGCVNIHWSSWPVSSWFYSLHICLRISWLDNHISTVSVQVFLIKCSMSVKSLWIKTSAK